MEQKGLGTVIAVALLATNAVSFAIGGLVYYKKGKQIKNEMTAFEGMKEIVKEVLGD